MSACALAPPRSPLQQKLGGTEMSVSELRMRVRALAPRFSGELETFTDEVSGGAEQPALRQLMVRFKSNAIPRMQAALMQADPVVALVEAWGLVAQLKPAVASMEELQPHPEARKGAQACIERMEAEIEQLWAELTGREDVSAMRERVYQWARENPLTQSLSARRSMAPLLAELSSREHVKLLGAAAQLLEDTQDLSTRLDLYAEYLPKQVRWQGEYLLRDLITDPSLLSSAIDPQGVAGLLDRQRSAVFQGLRAERLGMQQFLEKERTVLSANFELQLAKLLEAASRERQALGAGVDQSGHAWIDHFFDRATGLANHLFFLALQLLLLLVIAAALAVASYVLISSRGRRRPPSPAPPGGRPIEV